MAGSEIKKTYLKGGRLPPPNAFQTMLLSGLGLAFYPLFGLLARQHKTPGMEVRSQSFRLGWQLLFQPKAPIDQKTIFFLLCYPMDSTRYFELDFLLRSLPPDFKGTCLDVSSPRLGFTLLMRQNPELCVELINPDKNDLQESERLLKASGLVSQCRLHSCLITDAPFPPASMDLITCISVLEHIPEDALAVRKMWELLKPGGRLLLTVPCAAETSEQYMDQSEYGVLAPGQDGHVFWQRFYDSELLEEWILRVTGQPRRRLIFGEREAGLFQRNATAKRTQRYYPFWREPYMVSQEYRHFDAIKQLPGEGVCAMEFVKS